MRMSDLQIYTLFSVLRFPAPCRGGVLRYRDHVIHHLVHHTRLRPIPTYMEQDRQRRDMHFCGRLLGHNKKHTQFTVAGQEGELGRTASERATRGSCGRAGTCRARRPIWQSWAVRHASPARPLRSTLAPCPRRWCSTWRPQSLLCAPQQHAQREHPRATW